MNQYELCDVAIARYVNFKLQILQINIHFRIPCSIKLIKQKYVYHQSQYSQTWDDKWPVPVIQIVEH